MKILFIHQNFPAQFKNLAPALAAHGHDVVALTLRNIDGADWKGVRIARYKVNRSSTPDIHPWVADFEAKVIRGEACLQGARSLQATGYDPDVIIAHPGWGESLFLKDLWPKARLGVYCEFYYRPEGLDLGFDPEFGSADALSDAARVRLKNLNSLMHLEVADAGLSPTKFQADTFPKRFRERIAVIHEGVDTDVLAPRQDIKMKVALKGGATDEITRADEVITFVNRELEPYRGYHVFMRALPELLQRRPNAKILMVGGNGVSYGGRPDPAVHGERSWAQIFADEVMPRISCADRERVFFLGKIPYDQFVGLLQLSRVHVYLTYPFALSWSLLEAMSVGCAIVGSDTGPVRDVIEHGRTGRLVNFFDLGGLVSEISDLLDRPEERERLGGNARAFAREHFDLTRVCLPKQIAWVEGLAP